MPRERHARPLAKVTTRQLLAELKRRGRPVPQRVSVQLSPEHERRLAALESRAAALHDRLDALGS